MKKQWTIFLLSVILVIQTTAQRNRYKYYDWKAEPALSELTPEEEKEPAVILIDVRLYEYKLDVVFNNMELYKTVYKNIRINDDKAMDKYNKVAIPMRGVNHIVELKARSISPSGKVIELNKENIKELKNLAGYGNYKVFAIEGAETGGEIEYKYTISIKPRTSNTEIFQCEYPIRQGAFEIVTPHKYNVVAKGYNGFPDLTVDDRGRRAWTAVFGNVPGLPEEKYSTYEANLMKVSYTLTSRQDILSSRSIMDWKSISVNVYSTVSLSKVGAYNKAKKIIKQLELENLSKEDKIKAIENYVKSNYTLNRGASQDVINVIKTKQGNEMGITRLLAILFKKAGIDYQIIVTSDRYKSGFDIEFPVITNFDGILFYFKLYEKYIDPATFVNRFGMPPYEYTNNNALLITGEYNYEFHYINPSDTSQNVINKNIRITLNENLAYGDLEMNYRITGYRAMNARNVFRYSDEENQKEYLEYMAASGLEDVEITESDVQNEDFKYSEDNQPFIFHCKLKTSSIIEKAGKDVFINIGKVIGKQTELYQEKERIQPIDMRFPIVYNYTIGFEVPHEYNVVGLDDLKINQVFAEDNRNVAQFISDYQIEQNKVTITINEYYLKTIYKKESYSEFRNVVNAAADFSKKSVLLQKNN
ncbi:MAG: DUF3857 and transglutaminase domain-containing protein [Bacteroidales bacterium]|nr:DUF3857 and transglutaminase domain-containing protein [Bacteroidales bacterium]